MLDDELVSSRKMLDLGLTARQLHHWTLSGYLRALDDSPGSGQTRRYPPEELKVAERMLSLVDVGFGVAQAAKYARQPDYWVLVPATGDLGEELPTPVERLFFEILTGFDWGGYRVDDLEGPNMGQEWAWDLSRDLAERLRTELGL